MKVILIIVAVVALIIIVAKIRSGAKRNTAAMNALVAKYIFQRMTAEERTQVMDKIVTILQRDWRYSYEQAKKDIEKLNDKALFGFAALALAEMGINPEREIWQWQVVRNPYVALVAADKAIEIARIGLKKKGIDVSL